MNYLSKLIYYLIVYCRDTIKAQSKKNDGKMVLGVYTRIQQ